ncbi:MAG: SDR family oxidoreductase [Bacteroidetes bacterium]|nr:MAG: SDR family oxidoreductase [Bacteroidota bacterium]
MKVLLTGSTGYIGKRLLPQLVGEGHRVICMVRDLARFNPPESIAEYIEVIEADLLDEMSLDAIPPDIEAAYYLVHSMAQSDRFQELERKSAINFSRALSARAVKQVIYLGGIVNDEKELSEHLHSRLAVEHELAKGKYHLTILRAGIIIGSGSASFEIIRDLVEKLPVMVAPKWLHTRCQPIAIRDVISILSGVLDNPNTFDQTFDIGGPDVLSYKEMLQGYAKERGLRRYIITVPVMTPRLSSYWLYLVTNVSFRLARALVDSMRNDVVCNDHRIEEILPFERISYDTALRRALAAIENEDVLSSWKDAFSSSDLQFHIADFMKVPTHGCFKDVRRLRVHNREKTIKKIWRIGGEVGWYAANGLWRLRGRLDKLTGGIGLRRGRTHPERIHAGDAIDFWRVLVADKNKGYLLLLAEMKLPGEAWLEFRIEGDILTQTATFRPKGLWGRLYWYLVWPFHQIVFQRMVKRLAEG